MDHQYPTVAKIPVLDTGKFEQWQFRIQQYLQHEHYALWEVIEFGDSYKVPTNSDPVDSRTKDGRTVTVTTDDMQKKKNDVKARTTLLLSLPDEHQLRFSKYKTAKELWAAILKTFGDPISEFSTSGIRAWRETLILGEIPTITSHTYCPNSQKKMDHQYPTGKRIKFQAQQKKPNSNSQDMAFISSSKNINNEDGNISNGSHIKFKDINQIDEDDMEEMDIKWNMALLRIRADKFWKRTGKKISIRGSDVVGFDKSKVECFNCHKMGHFARECKAPRSQERGRRESYR
nr:ribonuclease H-like domain-containing protein [Tanacetum cinerariifolium]